MDNNVIINNTVELIVYAKDITRDNRTFTVYETTDNHKNRVSVAFTMTGKKPPEKGLFPVKIECVNGVDIWVDNRKRFPVYRISNYTLISTNVGAKNRGIPTD